MINHEEMSERKLKILHAIIQNYLETGEPVGSRTISKYTDLNLSSATIRNEMADLEEMGYIIQPHTSAGRIPSDKGYRLYVDMLMEEKEQELNEMQDQMLDKADKMDQLLKQAAKVLATNTNYATMVSTPMNNSNKIKFIQLSMVDEEQVIAVIVLGGNVIKNKIINIDEPISNENLLKLNMLLNTTLNGMSIEEINLGLIARLKEQAGIHSQVVGYVLDAVADAIHVDDDMQIYTSVATNIFKYPELSDNQSAQEIISAFEEKQQLSEEKQQLQGVSDRYERVVRVLGENIVENAVQQDIQEQKALEEKRQMEQMPKGSIHERLAWGARKSEMENQQRKKNKTKNRGMER